MKRGHLWFLVATAVLAFLPVVVGEYPLALAIEVMAFSIYALGINLLLGYTGYTSVGHSMFLGIGGYGIGVLTVLAGWPTWLAMVATMAITGVIGLFTGLICMRVSRIQFLVITLALSQLYWGIAVKTRATGGDDGLPGIRRPDLTWLGLNTRDTSEFYLYVVAMFLIAVYVCWRIVRSPFGSILVGIRENERRMVALGYPIALYKNAAFVASGLIAGFGGILMAQYQQFVSPSNMTWELSGEGLLMVIIGGRQYFIGPVLGAAFFVILKAKLADITEEYIIFFGLFFMFVVALFSRGLAGFGIDLWRRWTTRKPTAQAAE